MLHKLLPSSAIADSADSQACHSKGVRQHTAGWISISLGVTATPDTVEVNRRGLTTMSCVLTAAPVAESVTMHGRYASTAAEVVAICKAQDA